MGKHKNYTFLEGQKKKILKKEKIADVSFIRGKRPSETQAIIKKLWG